MVRVPAHTAARTALLARWRAWHSRRPLARCLVKVGLFLAVLALVLYPRVWLLPVAVSRLANLDALIEPQHPGLAPLAERVAPAVRGLPAPEALLTVELAVLDALPYAFDWETWGVAEYTPTVGEALAMGREDCDGRAVVAASLLRRLGYEARLLCDLEHVWVWTPAGEAMHPGRGATSLVSTPGGTQITWNWKLAENLARGTLYGVGVFPRGRQIILAATLVLLTLHPRIGPARLALGVAAVVCGYVLLAAGGSAAAYARSASAAPLGLSGAALMLGGWLTLAVKGAVGRSKSARPG